MLHDRNKSPDMEPTGHVLIGCRLAALYIVDRLKSEVITSAITHYQHIAVLQARRNIIKRILNRQKVKHPDHHKVCPSSLRGGAEGGEGGGSAWSGRRMQPCLVSTGSIDSQWRVCFSLQLSKASGCLKSIHIEMPRNVVFLILSV